MNNPGNTWDQVFQKRQCFNHQQRATTHHAPTDLRCCPGVQGASAAWDSDVCLIFPLVLVGLQTFHLKTTCSITTLKEEPAERDPGHDHQGTARDCPPTGRLMGATLPDQTSAIHHSAHHPDCGRLPGVSRTPVLNWVLLWQEPPGTGRAPFAVQSWRCFTETCLGLCCVLSFVTLD